MVVWHTRGRKPGLFSHLFLLQLTQRTTDVRHTDAEFVVVFTRYELLPESIFELLPSLFDPRLFEVHRFIVGRSFQNLKDL